jgi:DNA-binding protein HU-beta
LNKSELIDSVASSTGESKRVVGDVLDGFIDQVQKEVKRGQKVTLPGFGTFERRSRSARTARNPRTGEPIQVAASKVPAFKAGAGFKSYVSGK